MMGTKLRNFPPLTELSLEELVPKDNFYRHLQETLDLSFVRNLVGNRYAPSGRPSVEPVSLLQTPACSFLREIEKRAATAGGRG